MAPVSLVVNAISRTKEREVVVEEDQQGQRKSAGAGRKVAAAGMVRTVIFPTRDQEAETGRVVTKGGKNGHEHHRSETKAETASARTTGRNEEATRSRGEEKDEERKEEEAIVQGDAEAVAAVTRSKTPPDCQKTTPGTIILGHKKLLLAFLRGLAKTKKYCQVGCGQILQV